MLLAPGPVAEGASPSRPPGERGPRLVMVRQMSGGVGLRPAHERQEKVSAELVGCLHFQERVQELAKADKVDVLERH